MTDKTPSAVALRAAVAVCNGFVVHDCDYDADSAEVVAIAKAIDAAGVAELVQSMSDAREFVEAWDGFRPTNLAKLRAALSPPSPVAEAKP